MKPEFPNKTRKQILILCALLVLFGLTFFIPDPTPPAKAQPVINNWTPKTTTLDPDISKAIKEAYKHVRDERRAGNYASTR